jgi:hypothetical protein
MNKKIFLFLFYFLILNNEIKSSKDNNKNKIVKNNNKIISYEDEKLKSRLRWGTYHPNLLGGISEAKQNPLSLRMMILYDGEVYYNYREQSYSNNFEQIIFENNGKDSMKATISDKTNGRQLFIN